jgi:hypothetical protein
MEQPQSKLEVAPEGMLVRMLPTNHLELSQLLRIVAKATIPARVLQDLAGL